MTTVQGKALLKFFNTDIAEARTSDGGIEIVSGGTISDRDLYYQPLKATIISILDHPFFKVGDVVYAEYTVWNLGEGTKNANDNRTIEKHDDGVVKWANLEELFCKVENGKIIPTEHFIICEGKVEIASNNGLIVTGIAKQKIYGTVIKYVNEYHEDLKQGDKIIVEEVGFYSYNRIEGKWLYCIPHDLLLAKVNPSAPLHLQPIAL